MTGGGHDTTAVKSQRPRWWQDARWITAGVIAVTVVFLLWGLFGPEAAIRVSRETTFITEPLAADGLPDYPAAVLAMAGPAPPPEENAAAALLQVCWPMGIRATDLPAVCAALGIPDEPPDEPLRLPHEESGSKVTFEMFDATTKRPWKGAEIPELAAWLVRNEAKIDAIVAASGLPRVWLPSPTLVSGTPGLLLALELPEVSALRDVKRILACRAMWHGGEGRVTQAWRDTRAIFRLSRLLAAPKRRPQFLVTCLVAMAIEKAACDILVQAILANDRVSHALLVEICCELDKPSRPMISADCIEIERLSTIDCLLSLGPRNQGGSGVRGGVAQDLVGMGLLLATSLDWNVVLNHVNQHYDNTESALRISERALQQVTLNAQEEALRVEVKAWGGIRDVLMLVCNRGSRSAVFARHATLHFTPSFSPCVVAVHRSRAHFMLARTAVALADWRRDHGAGDLRYPDRLDDLAPEYLSAVPVDPFSDKPLVYERRGDGYLLASVGENGIFDDGDDVDGWIVNGEWQDEARDVPREASDLVIRVPVPERPFTPPASP